MNEGILGAIANPQLADVAGALNYRQAQIDKDEQKRKELRMNQLIAQAIPNMAADSPIRKIFEEDPKTGAMISKAIGIPLNDGEAWEKFRGNVAQLHSLAKADPRMAIERANAMKAENDRLGIVDKQLNSWVGNVNSAMEKGDQDGVITQFNALGVMNDNLNPVKAAVITAKDKAELALREREVAVKERDSRNGVGAGGLSPKDVVMTPNGAYVFDKRTGGFSKGLDEAGNPIVGANYDPTLKRNISSAVAEGAAAGKDRADATIDLPKIESSSAKVIGLVNELLTHKGKSSALGASSYLPSIRGTERAGFDNRLKQIQGDAFLKAFESLKGGGAITEMEGQKATQALNRMNETVNEEEFDSAAKDFISEVNRFKDIAAQRAGMKTEPKEKVFTGQDKPETAAQRLARLTSGK